MRHLDLPNFYVLLKSHQRAEKCLRRYHSRGIPAARRRRAGLK